MIGLMGSGLECSNKGGELAGGASMVGVDCAGRRLILNKGH